jgi:hypothetical protein
MKKRILLFVIALISAFLISGCFPKALETLPPENNESYRVSYLFEHDGCKVYRFRDRGNWVYFTNCLGDVTSIQSDSTATRTRTIGGFDRFN